MSIVDTSPVSEFFFIESPGQPKKSRRQAVKVASGIKPSDHLLGIVTRKSQPSYLTSAAVAILNNKTKSLLNLIMLLSFYG